MAIFEDLLISYRGAGLIGTLLGGIVLLGFAILATFAFDPGLNGSRQSLAGLLAGQKREAARLSADLESVRLRHREYQAGKVDPDRMRVLRAALREREDKLADLEHLDARAEEASGRLQAGMASYVAAYRAQVRAAAVGETLDSLTTLDGRTIRNATITGVSPAGIHLRHAEGITRVSPENLPAGLRRRFQFDQEEMAAFLEKERQSTGEMEREIDRGLAAIRKEERRERLAYLEGRVPVLQKRIKLRRRRIRESGQQDRSERAELETLRRQLMKDLKELSQALRELDRLRAEAEKADR